MEKRNEKLSRYVRIKASENSRAPQPLSQLKCHREPEEEEKKQKKKMKENE